MSVPYEVSQTTRNEGRVKALMAMRAERDTPTGLATASRWLGLRRQLAGDESFGEQPPAAVAARDIRT